MLTRLSNLREHICSTYYDYARHISLSRLQYFLLVHIQYASFLSRPQQRRQRGEETRGGGGSIAPCGTFGGAALKLNRHTFFNHKNIGAIVETHILVNNSEITFFCLMKPTLICIRVVLPDDS